MARVSVIGGNGFLGSHLVDALAAAGHEVTAFDRFTQRPPVFEANGVAALTGDFMSDDDLVLAVTGQDTVFHMLSTTTPATADADPAYDIRTNVVRTLALIDACVDAGIGRLVFASTGGAIYGPQHKGRYRETDAAEPISPYGIGKLAIERYLEFYRRQRGLNSVTCRISNPYGTRQQADKPQGLIPIALRQIARDLPVVRLGDGSMVRDYIYVDDVVQMLAPLAIDAVEHSVYNIGSGIGLTVNDVLATLERVTQREVMIDERPQPPSFVDEVVLDTTRFTDEFGERSLTALDEGVAATWEAILRHDHE
ncbi:NAD-dependent epimerase/dehydratase family protein [Demequina sp.]|uniref:NAD-dependent epimerase/dehydratase family protein n=1 Tax=Demequina sp. TaxID=2050685 RepID=UPI0025C22AF3|nr:NAD-dependent epimerase/dehydratase family protein [Demequina sp.]